MVRAFQSFSWPSKPSRMSEAIFFFHWRYSPVWALACQTVFFHYFLSATNSVHILTPSTWRSLSTSSFHLFLGLPLLLVPSSSWVKNFLVILSSSILSKPSSNSHLILNELSCLIPKTEFLFLTHRRFLLLKICKFTPLCNNLLSCDTHMAFFVSCSYILLGSDKYARFAWFLDRMLMKMMLRLRPFIKSKLWRTPFLVEAYEFWSTSGQNTSLPTFFCFRQNLIHNPFI